MDNVEEFMSAVDRLDKELRAYMESHQSQKSSKGSMVSVATVYHSLDMGDVQVNVWLHPSGYKTFRMPVDNQGRQSSVEMSKKVVEKVLEKRGWSIVSKQGASGEDIFIRV